MPIYCVTFKKFKTENEIAVENFLLNFFCLFLLIKLYYKFLRTYYRLKFSKQTIKKKTQEILPDEKPVKIETWDEFKKLGDRMTKPIINENKPIARKVVKLVL